MVECLLVMKIDNVECQAYVLTKKHREEFPTHQGKKQKEILELIHVDVSGPMQTRYLGALKELCNS